MRSGFRVIGVLALVGLALAGAVAPPAGAQIAAGPVQGTLVITRGACAQGTGTGSYFRMILPTGTRTGPFIENGDSACSDKTFTLLVPGTDGGLQLGAYQPKPSPTFDAKGNATSGRVTRPTPFFSVDFAPATNPTDPQTGTKVAAPALSLGADGKLTGDVRSFAASWNNQEFNQGAPKPDGSLPGNTAAPAGTLDPATGRFVLEWTSQIVGGPFDRFTGLWHLEGTLSAAGGGASAPVATNATGATAAGDSGSAATASTAAGAAASATTSATKSALPSQDDGDEERAGPSATVSGGSEPSTSLVLLVAFIGLAAFGTFLTLDRRIRRLEAGS